MAKENLEIQEEILSDEVNSPQNFKIMNKEYWFMNSTQDISTILVKLVSADALQKSRLQLESPAISF